MLRLISNIIITQQPTAEYPSRSGVLTLNFINDCEIKSSWKNLTTTAKLIFPKKVWVQTDKGLVNWTMQDLYANTHSDQAPILLRGDRISINLGYYYNPNGTGNAPTMNEEFNGFITRINPKMPIEIECEDNMWLLKQAQCPNKVFPKGQYNVQSIIQYLLKNQVLPLPSDPQYKYITTVIKPALAQINVINGVGASENIETNVGDFRTQNETIAQVLFRLRKDYKLDCFFRPTLTNGKPTAFNNLYVSGIVYYPSDYILPNGKYFGSVYNFQQNVIDTNDLIYLRKEDVRLGIKAYSVGKYEIEGTNSAGRFRTKQKRLETTVGDSDGDIRTQFFWAATNESPDLDLKTLTDLATQRLLKLKYDGWRGSFTSFGLPYCQHGSAVQLVDTIIPERTGTYLVKSVTVKFGMNGFRRIVEPHLRIDLPIYTTDQNGNKEQVNLQNGL